MNIIVLFMAVAEMNSQTETQLQNEIRACLQQLGWATVRTNSGMRGYLKFISWKLPDNWTARVEPDEILDIFPKRNISEVYDRLGKRLTTGFADIVALGPGGRTIFLEVKKPGEKPTPEQRFFLLFMRRLGFVAEVVDSVEAVEKLISNIESERTG